MILDALQNYWISTIDSGFQEYKMGGIIIMTFIVEITLRTEEPGRGIRVFYKEIGAANENQACDFAKQMLEGFLTEDITVETRVISDSDIKLILF